MSEMIRNSEERKELVRKIIRKVESGEDIASAKASFSKLLKTISPEEIAEVEQSLIAEGMPVDHVQKLCDLHVEAFQSALKEQTPVKPLPGHPVDTYRRENREARKRIRPLLRSAAKLKRGRDDGSFPKALEDLKRLLIHFARKENQLFPYLEQVGFTGPSKVMWGKHDEIREVFREIQSAYVAGNSGEVAAKSRELGRRIKRMIFMEERILFPTAMRKLTDATWAEIRRGETEIGYAWIAPGNLWDPSVLGVRTAVATEVAAEPESVRPGGAGSGAIPLGVGSLDATQIDLMLKNLSLDVSFVDEHDRVQYYSDTADRIFPRSPGVIGRTVQNCHPPKSVATVEKILEAFRRKEKREAEFWIEMGGRFIHIRYFALYDDRGEYRGVIEVSQDVTDIRKLEGTRTLLDW